jgi:hypothetical protein
MKRIALLSVLLVTAGCGGGESTTTPPTPSSESRSTTSQAPHTLAALVEDPCAAITDEDAAALGVSSQGTLMPSDPGTCTWPAPGGIVGFAAFPDRDETAGMAAKPGAQPITVAGKTAVRLTVDTSCFTFVTVADGQSFRVDGSGDPSVDMCEMTQRFAAAVVANLA